MGDPAAFVLVVTTLYLTVGRTPFGVGPKDSTMLKLPLVGPVVQYAVVERFCRILCSMVNAGVPLPESLRLAADGSNNVIYEKAIMGARAMMKAGRCRTHCVRRSSSPPLSRRCSRSARTPAPLDDQLESMAAYYEKELEYKLKNMTTMFEPIAILLMAGIVGFVAVALVSAMYGIFNQVKR